MALPVPVVLLQPLGPNGPSIDSQGGSNRKKEGNASHVINSSLNMIFIVISYVKLQSKCYWLFPSSTKYLIRHNRSLRYSC